MDTGIVLGYSPIRYRSDESNIKVVTSKPIFLINKTLQFCESFLDESGLRKKTPLESLLKRQVALIRKKECQMAKKVADRVKEHRNKLFPKLKTPTLVKIKESLSGDKYSDYL